MKIFNKFMALAAAALLGFGWASAEVVENYTVDFNTAISTTPSDFRVAPGWRHIVPQRAGTYTYSSTAGVDDSGTLKCAQYSTSYIDALVTPKLTGSASLQVKVSNSNPYGATFKAYKVVEEDGVFSLGDEIVNKTCSDQTQGFYTYEDYTYTFYWVNVEMADLAGDRIALVGNNVYIDNLVVTGSAEIELLSSLSITHPSNTGWLYPNCDEDNNFSVTMTGFKVTNNGECPIAVGTDGYNVTICPQNHPEAPVYTYTIPTGMEVGDELSIPDITFEMSYDDFLALPGIYSYGAIRLDGFENITGTSVLGNYVQPNPYLPGMQVKDSGNNTLESGNTTFGSFGMISEDATKTLTIKSTGAAPLVATLAVPEGFTASATDINLANGETLEVNIMLSAATPGIFSGDLTITGEGIDDFVLPLSGTVLDPNKFFEDFQANPSLNVMPSGWWDMDDYWDKTTNTSTYYPNNWVKGGSVDNHKLVTPLLHVTEGEKMTFEASRYHNNSGEEYNARVYYSADRENWTLVKTITPAEMQQGNNSDQKFTTFVVEGVPAGNYYIAFEGYFWLDNVYGFELVPVDHDVVIKSVNIPTTGKQNDDYTASVTLLNLLNKVESCDASFVLGTQADIQSPVEVGALATTVVNFTLVPNVPGEWEAQASFTWEDDYEVATDEVDVTITEETAEKFVEVSDENYTNRSTSSSSPVNPNYENSESMSIYTADQLGLTAGDKITSLTWRGYKTGNDHTTQVSVWIGSTDATSLTTSQYSGSLLPTDGMTEAYNAPYTFVKGGSSSAMIDMLKIDLAEPFEYQGGNLCIVVRSQHISDTYKSVTFESFPYSLTGQCISHRTDDGDINNTSPLAAASYSASNLPIVTFGVKMEPVTVSGIVTDEEGNPLEGVYVEAESVDAAPAGEGAPRLAATAGPVAYQAVTDADGVYTLPIIQTDKQYNITYSLDGYNDEVIENVDLSNGAITQNVTLTREMFAIEIDCGENGSAETNPADEAAAGTDVVLTVTPDNGYVIDQIMVLDSDEEEIDLIPGTTLNTFTFEMPMDDVLIVVTFKLDEATGVDDLNAASIKGVKYYNVAGVASDKPFDGMNIVVTRNADGSVKVQKVMF